MVQQSRFRPVLHRAAALASLPVSYTVMTGVTGGTFDETLQRLGLERSLVTVVADDEKNCLSADVQLEVELVDEVQGATAVLQRAVVLASEAIDAGEERIVWVVTMTTQQCENVCEALLLSYAEDARVEVVKVKGGDAEAAAAAVRLARDAERRTTLVLVTTSCATTGLDLRLGRLIAVGAWSVADFVQAAARVGRGGHGGGRVTLLVHLQSIRAACMNKVVAEARMCALDFNGTEDAMAAPNAYSVWGVLRMVSLHVEQGLCLRRAVLLCLNQGDRPEVRCKPDRGCAVCRSERDFKRGLRIVELGEMAQQRKHAKEQLAPRHAVELLVDRPVLEAHSLASAQRAAKLQRRQRLLDAAAKLAGKCLVCREPATDWTHARSCPGPRSATKQFEGESWRAGYGHEKACNFCGQAVDTKTHRTVQGVAVTHRYNGYAGLMAIQDPQQKLAALQEYNREFGCAIRVDCDAAAIRNTDECLLWHEARNGCNAVLRLGVRRVLLRIYYRAAVWERLRSERVAGQDWARFRSFREFVEFATRNGDAVSKVSYADELVGWWVERPAQGGVAEAER